MTDSTLDFISNTAAATIAGMFAGAMSVHFLPRDAAVMAVAVFIISIWRFEND